MSRRGVSSRSTASTASGIGGPSSRPLPPSTTSASTSRSTSNPTTAPPTARPNAPTTTKIVGTRVAARGPGVGGGGGSSARVHDPSGRISEYWAQDDKCPQCKTDRLIAPKLRLLVSPCYHKMCESCVDRIFSLGSAPCPQCGTTCRKNQFGVQTFSDLGVEREVDVRRRVAKIYNKQEKDFPSMEAYNNYLEEVEEITFNLINNIDPTRTEARISQHEHANRSLITRNASSLSLLSSHLASTEQAERTWRLKRADVLRKREEEERVWKEGRERELLDLDEEGEGESADVFREKWARKWREIEDRRKREDEVAERERVVMLGSSSSSKNVKEGGGGGVDLKAGLYRPWMAEMVLDFEGPLARLDDGRVLFDIPTPPARLLAFSGPEEGKRSTERGYLDLYGEQPRLEEDAKKVRVGGYDWTEVLRRRVRSGLEGMWVAPLA
ncbi:hypothetical protein CF319_g2627 [Tilletia indica]|nr:hypothetical protein CF319_g2627 [Tilletia indica]